MRAPPLPVSRPRPGRRAPRAALAVTCAWLAALLPAAWPAPAPPAEAALQEALAGLVAPDLARRLAALGELGDLVAQRPGLGSRCLPRLRAILRLRGSRERAMVMPVLLRLADPEARALWLHTLDPAVEAHDLVLAAAVEAPRHAPADQDLAKALLAVVGDERASPARRALALEALGWMEGPAAALVVERARAGETWVEACGRALALGRRPSPRSVPPLLALLRHEELAPRVHAWESLVRLAGRDLPLEPAAWEAWWAARDPQAPLAPPAPPAAGPRYAAPRPLHVPHYYGIPIPRRASRVVFCLDASQSMYGSGIDEARRELTRALMDLPATHAFEIVVFNAKVMPWAGRLVQAHPVQKWLAARHLAAIEPTSYTNIYDALELALGHAGRGPRAVRPAAALDAVFLLSDGAPNRGRYRTPEGLVRHVAELSGRSIPVHTIGAGEEVFPLLRAIAAATGGTFVDAFE